MTKEQWENISKLEEIPFVVWWEYYKESGGIITDFSEFVSIFVQLMTRPILIHSTGRVIALNFEICIHRLYHYYNKKFDLV